MLFLVDASSPSASPTATAPRSEAQVTEGIVRAAPSELWKVFATAEGFKTLGVAQCDLDLRLGGLIRSHYDSAGVSSAAASPRPRQQCHLHDLTLVSEQS